MATWQASAIGFTFAVIGAVVGTYLGGQTALGAQMGMSLGMAIGGAVGGMVGSALYPDRPEIDKVPPPQPGESRVQISSYGAPRGILIGTVRKAGNVLKMQPPVETVRRSKHRQNGVRYYEYTRIYTSTFAIGFGPGPAVGISRLWVNGQVWYDSRDPAGEYYPPGSLEDTQLANINASVDRAAKYFQVYLGTEDQEPDPVLESIFGAGQVPAYRGEILAVFYDFPVGENRGIPTIEAEIVKDGTVSTETWMVDFTDGYPGLTHHQAMDDDGNLIKYDATSGRVITFRAKSNVVLRSFAAPAPAGWQFLGLGFDPNTGLLILGYCYTAGSGYGQVVRHYVVNTSGQVIADPWTAPTVYGGGDAGFQYAFTSDGMVVHYSTSAYYNYSWHYGSLAVLYESVYGGEVDRVWGLNPTSDPTNMAYSRLKPLWADLPDSYSQILGAEVQDLTPYLYLGDGSQYWRFRWADLVKSGTSFPIGTIPEACKTVASILNPRSGYAGAMTDLNGDLLTYDSTNDELYLHAGVSNTIRTRSRVLESGCALDVAVTRICALANVPAAKLDVAALAADKVLGFNVPRVMSARTALETLLRAYQVQAAEVDWKLVFSKLGGASILTIPDDDLGAAEGDQPAENPIVEDRSAGEVDLPSHLLLSYESKKRDYQTAVQPAYRGDRAVIRVQNESIGLVLTDTKAKRLAEILLKAYWNRSSYRYPLPPKYGYLAPGDVITVRGKDMRIVNMTDRNGPIDVTASAEPGGTWTSAAEAQEIGFELIDIEQAAFVPEVVLLDLPALSVDHGQAGCYAAMYGPSYRGGTLQRSSDGGATWQDVAYFGATAAQLGQCTTILGAGRAGHLDYTAGVTVDMSRSGASLASASDAELAAGANLAAIGSAATGWEIVQFKTATLSSGAYVLTGLLRGLYGTAARMAGHGAGEHFVLLGGLAGIEFASIDPAVAGVAMLYRAVNPAGVAGSSFEHAATLLPIQPLPPAAVRAGRTTAGIAIAWARADRYEFAYEDLPDNRDVPMSEVAESYEIDILNPVTLEILRTLAAASRTVTYTAAQQAADGYPALVLSDDCAGSLATNFTDNDAGLAASSFTGGQLVLYCPASSSTAGANATAQKVLNRQGKTVVGLRWQLDVGASELLEDYSTEVVVHKSAPTFATAAWAYGRPEYGVGANSFLALAYHYSSGFYVSVVSRISGAAATVAQVAIAGVNGQWVDLVWQIDWAAHTVTVWMDGVKIIDAAAFSSAIDTPLTSTLQVTFRGNHYGGRYYYMDDIRLAGNMAAAGPLLVDVYQLSAAAGRGVAARASV